MKRVICVLLIICILMALCAHMFYSAAAKIITDTDNGVVLNIGIKDSTQKLSLSVKWEHLLRDAHFEWTDCVEFITAKLNKGATLDSYRIRYIKKQTASDSLLFNIPTSLRLPIQV